MNRSVSFPFSLSAVLAECGAISTLGKSHSGDSGGSVGDTVDKVTKPLQDTVDKVTGGGGGGGGGTSGGGGGGTVDNTLSYADAKAKCLIDDPLHLDACIADLLG